MAFAIVPAGGNSTRMGRPKLTLPLGNTTVIGRVVSTLRAGGVERIVVVVGPHVSELIPLAQAAGADVLALSEPTPDMRTTVERGLEWIGKHCCTAMHDWWFLAPADHPAFAASVISNLLSMSDEARRSIIVPTHNGRRGHPALFRWHHAAGINAMPKDAGINSYLHAQANEVLELPVTDAGILANLDTPEDYARLMERL